jgi:hypothetical protein
MPEQVFPHHLSPEINRVVNLSNDPTNNLNLDGIEAGKVVNIDFGIGPKRWSMSVQIVHPGQTGYHGTHPDGIITKGDFLPEQIGEFGESGLPIPLIGVECIILGACSYNPNASDNMSMLKMHHITIGRSLAWATPLDDKDCMLWVAPELVTTVSVR